MLSVGQQEGQEDAVNTGLAGQKVIIAMFMIIVMVLFHVFHVYVSQVSPRPAQLCWTSEQMRSRLSLRRSTAVIGCRPTTSRQHRCDVIG